MTITRRSAAIGGLSLLAGTSISTTSYAELGSFLVSEEVSRTFGSLRMRTCTAIRW